MRRRYLVLGLLTSSFALLLASPAYARRFRLPRMGGIVARTKRYTADTMTQADLERCLVRGQEIDNEELSVSVTEQELTLLQSELDDLGREIDSDRRTLDQYSQAAVDRFNAKIDVYEEQRLAFNNAVERYNRSADAFNSTLTTYNAACANKSYYEDDMQAARAAVGIFD
jgi:hypothetical protein